MTLSGQEVAFLKCGTFTLKNTPRGEIAPAAENLLAQGLVEKTEVQPVGEMRFTITERGRRAIEPEGMISSTEFEEQVAAGNVGEGGVVQEKPSEVVQVQAGDQGDVAGAESSSGESQEDPPGKV